MGFRRMLLTLEQEYYLYMRATIFFCFLLVCLFNTRTRSSKLHSQQGHALYHWKALEEAMMKEKVSHNSNVLAVWNFKEFLHLKLYKIGEIVK